MEDDDRISSAGISSIILLQMFKIRSLSLFQPSYTDLLGSLSFYILCPGLNPGLNLDENLVAYQVELSIF